jgi:predicted nucleic acid-binding protein
MTPLLLDSSVWLAWIREDDEPDHVDAARLITRRARGEIELRLLDLTVYELGNVAVRAWRRSVREADTLVVAALDIASSPPLVPNPAERRAAHRLAEEHRLSVYDATYAAVALERRLTLVSRDRRLLKPGLATAPADV